jgi:hypothetical protein
MPRFVLLFHVCPPKYPRPSHWDLMLEAGGALETWALPALPHAWHAARQQTAATFPACPAIAVDNSIIAERLAGHRLAYLDYEGPVSGERGEVFRIAAGTFTLESQSAERWLVSRPAPWRNRVRTRFTRQ